MGGTDQLSQGEYDLCGVQGINCFAAALLLSQISLEDFLEKFTEARLSEFGELIGMDRIVSIAVPAYTIRPAHVT